MFVNRKTVVINDGNLSSGGSSVSTVAQWPGGDGVLVISATQYAPIVNLMFTTTGGGNNQIKINTSTINVLQSNQRLPFGFPAGTYQIHSATGSSVDLYVAIAPI